MEETKSDALFPMLDAKQNDYSFQIIAVKFAGEKQEFGLEFESIQYVDATDADRIEKLNRLIQLGGEPFGIVRVAKDGKLVICQPLPGHENYVEEMGVFAEIEIAARTGVWKKSPLIAHKPRSVVN